MERAPSGAPSIPGFPALPHAPRRALPRLGNVRKILHALPRATRRALPRLGNVQKVPLVSAGSRHPGKRGGY